MTVTSGGMHIFDPHDSSDKEKFQAISDGQKLRMMYRYPCCNAYGPYREDHLCWGKCCQLAQPTNCVCAASFTCPIHGDRHYGTHD